MQIDQNPNMFSIGIYVKRYRLVQVSTFVTHIPVASSSLTMDFLWSIFKCMTVELILKMISNYMELKLTQTFVGLNESDAN